MHHFLRYVHKLFRLNNLLLAFITIGFILLSSLIAYWMEPETFQGWFNSLYWVMTTMATVGYGDYFMKTTAGKAFTILLYLFGIGLLSVVIGKIIESFSYFKLRREMGRVNFHGRSHVVIISWNRKANAAVEELLVSDPSLEIVIIDENEKLPCDHKRVHYISGKLTSDETLLRAGLQFAKSAIIFADEKIDDYLLIDGKSLLIASSIERLAPHVHTTVEIMSEKHIKNFSHIHVNEFILSHDAVSNLAVRSALNQGTIDLYMQLISRQHGEDIYQVKKKDTWVTYQDAFQDLLTQGATLLADRNDLGINRKLHSRIPEDAKLYVVCDSETYQKLLSS